MDSWGQSQQSVEHLSEVRGRGKGVLISSQDTLGILQD